NCRPAVTGRQRVRTGLEKRTGTAYGVLRRRLNACASPDETSLRAGKTFADAAGAAAQPDPAPRPAAEQTPVLQTDRGMRARRLSRTGACDPRAPACDDQRASRGCCAAFQVWPKRFSRSSSRLRLSRTGSRSLVKRGRESECSSTAAGSASRSANQGCDAMMSDSAEVAAEAG